MWMWSVGACICTHAYTCIYIYICEKSSNSECKVYQICLSFCVYIHEYVYIFTHEYIYIYMCVYVLAPYDSTHAYVTACMIMFLLRLGPLGKTHTPLSPDWIIAFLTHGFHSHPFQSRPFHSHKIHTGQLQSSQKRNPHIFFTV